MSLVDTLSLPLQELRLFDTPRLLSGAIVALFRPMELAPLRVLQSLGELRVLRIPNGSRETLRSMGHLRHLEQLDVTAPTTDQALTELANLHGLQRLSLTGPLVTSEGLRHLAHLTQLRVLRLDGTRVGDRGVRHLRGMTALRQLDLRRTSVTRVGLIGLSHLRHLGYVGLGPQSCSPRQRFRS